MDLIIAFFSGVGATLLGFLLTFFWELKKIWDQEAVILASLKNKLGVNMGILGDNLILIEDELRLLESDKCIVAPFFLLDADIMGLLSFCTPKKIRTNPNFLSKIVTLSRLSKNLNETVQSRESYRISNGAMTNHSERLKIYDGVLRSQINNLRSLTSSVLLEFDN